MDTPIALNLCNWRMNTEEERTMKRSLARWFSQAFLVVAIGALGVIGAAGVAGATSTATPNAGSTASPPSGTDVPAGVSATLPAPTQVIHTTSPSGVPITETIEPLTYESINTVHNYRQLTTSGYCTFSVEYGNFLGAAYGKTRLDSGNCNTTPDTFTGPPPYDDGLANGMVTGLHTGTLVNGGRFVIIDFHTWVQSTVDQADVVDYTTWVCAEVHPGNPQYGINCIHLELTPF